MFWFLLLGNLFLNPFKPKEVEEKVADDDKDDEDDGDGKGEEEEEVGDVSSFLFVRLLSSTGTNLIVALSWSSVDGDSKGWLRRYCLTYVFVWFFFWWCLMNENDLAGVGDGISQPVVLQRSPWKLLAQRVLRFLKMKFLLWAVSPIVKTQDGAEVHQVSYFH